LGFEENTSPKFENSSQQLNQPLNIKTSIQAFIHAHQQSGHHVAGTLISLISRIVSFGHV
jgi:hypothetical protein